MAIVNGNMQGANTVIASASLLRWIACFMIFFHHYLKSIGIISSYGFSPITAIGTFCCLAGVFANSRSNTSLTWLQKKFFRIMVPAWIISLPMLGLNMLIQAKAKSIGSVIMEIAGLQFFVIPLFEAMWFVTFILGLYVAVYLSGLLEKLRPILLLVLCAAQFYLFDTFGALDYLHGWKLAFWIALFYGGYITAPTILAVLRKADEYLSTKWMPVPGQRLPAFPDLTYYFYLAHPPILYLLTKIPKLSKEATFFSAIVISIVACVVVQILDRRINRLFRPFLIPATQS